MSSPKAQLKARYRKALRKVERENDLIIRARDRKEYWLRIAREIEDHLEMVKSGQAALPFNS